MELNNIPIETISKFNTLGDIIPLRIRLEDEEHRLVTSNITEIIYSNKNNYAGIKTFDFGCKVIMNETERLLELRYYVDTHKWTLRKILY